MSARSTGELTLIASIADDLPCGVWVSAAPDGRFVYANRAFDEIMGMGPVTDVGVGEYTVPYGIYGRDGKLYPESRLPFVRALQERTTVVVDDLVIHRRDGRRVYVRAFGKPIFDGDAITHVAIAFFDITREAEAQEARERMQTQLERSERLASLGMLAAGMAHEINNPLTFVVGSLELLESEMNRAGESVSGPLAERIQDARVGLERVRAIVRDLKTFARVQESRVGAVELGPVIERALAMVHGEIRHRARIVLELGHVPRVVADEGRLGQVFVNLLVNAAQAIPEGDADANEIRVVARTEGGAACVEIHDTGAGMAPDVLERIFDPFFTTKVAGAGTGLGLSICQAIVSALGGRIDAKSTPGRGTVFRVVLPGAPADAPTRKPESAAPPPKGRRGSILIVDDEPLVLKVLVSLLSGEHEVSSETTAGAALARIRAGERFDAIVCDLMMPQVTGIDLYETLLEIAPRQAESTLFLTGGAFTPRARAFVDRMAASTLDKPIDARTLCARVRQIVGE